MFGNKENDGFLDGLAREIADVATTWVVLFIIYYTFVWYFRCWRTKPIVTFIWTIVFLAFIQYAKLEQNKSMEEKLKNIPEVGYPKNY